ncbi:hypothetical protein HAU13_01120 [Weissella confusa]|uniref:hypothetical protein n=1 Tax=Weissella confusa TaxID=1583 RepID=UPI000F8047AC|nr:hypothetical protein [Weissella confusa]MBJ7621370.1 hypothetical protein [Weissella confusa]
MAKWKNALLISTIVAPIAFGASPLGDAFAQADRPSSTNVQVHKMETTTDGTDSQNVLWGSGSERTRAYCKVGTLLRLISLNLRQFN